MRSFSYFVGNPMSHWYRSPSSFSLAKLLSRRHFLLDSSVSGEAASCFPAEASVSRPADGDREKARQELARQCYTRHSVLVTADREFVPFLNIETMQAWGILLMPEEVGTHADILKRMFRGRLVFRPSAERAAMIELVGQNRFLLDVSFDEPALTLFCSCRWAS